MMRHWVWVFGEIDGLRWVLEHDRMAFPEHAAGRISRMEPGDRAILYVTRGAFHNPTRDRAHLAGVTRVTSDPRQVDDALVIAGRDFTWTVGHEPEMLMDERHGPHVRPLVERLEMVRRPESWGSYFRASPIEISADDFDLLRNAVLNH
ncbi:EVE domain-containing protein [Salsipaludibacter albus]|uniref:EVE domain-containing protein n=1 Tax=Salsipaludibacter albus TaxID=2849650 RepID=UPI001EE3E7C2|nr:EVE domain-containing protein [Salsipaludibacter albus]MBY5162099.1 EVE domain-containing protein [Salsipaludibacter albus]